MFSFGKRSSFVLTQPGLPARRPQFAPAFSLVETAMAIGLMAFAFVSIFGLIPMGLSTFRKAMDQSVNSMIVQQVAADLQQNNSIQTGPQPFRYFDEQGNYLGSSDTTPPDAAFYFVNTVTQYPAQVPGGSSPQLASVTVEIAGNPQKTALQRDSVTSAMVPASGVSIVRSSIFLSHQP